MSTVKGWPAFVALGLPAGAPAWSVADHSDVAAGVALFLLVALTIGASDG